MSFLKKRLKKHMITVIVTIAVLAFLLVKLEKFNSWVFVQGPLELKALFDSFSYLAPLIFIAIYVIANIFLLPSYPFLFISGVVFGLYWGTILSFISEVLSATANYYLGRKSQKLFIHEFHNEKIKFVLKYVKEHGFNIIMMLRYLGFYFGVVSYASGIAKIKYRDFIIATFIGFLPYILIYVYSGVQLMNIKSSSFIYSILIFKIVLFGVFILGYLLYRWLRSIKNSSV